MTTVEFDTLSSQVFYYLDSLNREIAYTMKPKHLKMVPTFADVDTKTLSQYIARWKKKKPTYQTSKSVENNSTNTVERVETTQQQIQTRQHIPSDLLEDIDKVKAVMNRFGEGVRLKEVTDFLKDMNALKPSKEEQIKESLKNESVDALIDLIIPQEYQFQPTYPSTFNANELQSLFDESDL